MSNTTRTLTLLLLGFLALSTYVACDEASRFDGRWRAEYTTSPSSVYEMEFSGGRFHAVQGEQWYKGEIVIDTEADPARFDFIIRECDCNHVDKTSTGIFRWVGDVIEIRAPEPGDPRPTEFDEESGETMRLVRESD
ncbi:MAG: hypothetical protein OEV00_13750 [Acidobacteriota bacterium]|nr:hypothetical protein [Acidobacteriota bacterium]MDH3786374.1 hypothetical protein [Acidobacteriota bacterium]